MEVLPEVVPGDEIHPHPGTGHCRQDEAPAGDCVMGTPLEPQAVTTADLHCATMPQDSLQHGLEQNATVCRAGRTTPEITIGGSAGVIAPEVVAPVRKAVLVKRHSSLLQPVSEEEVLGIMERSDFNELMSSMPPCDCDTCQLSEDEDSTAKRPPVLKRVNIQYSFLLLMRA